MISGKQELGGRPDVIGSTVTLDNSPYTVVGVMPKNFRHPYRAQVWLPLGARYATAGRGHYLYGVGRLRLGVTIAQADSAMRAICRRINSSASDPLNPRRAYIRPLREGFVVDLGRASRHRCRRPLHAPCGCSHLAGLLLARSVSRDGETAVRAALGATRARLVRETLTLALMLAAVGAATGLLLAAWLTPTLVAMSPEGTDATGSAMREFDYVVRLDWPVFGFAAGALILAGAGFGLIPAWRSSRADLRSAIGSSGRSATIDRGTRRLLGCLVVAEIGAAALLLVASALLTQYFKGLVDEPWGFQSEHRLTFNTLVPARFGADGPGPDPGD